MDLVALHLLQGRPSLIDTRQRSGCGLDGRQCSSWKSCCVWFWELSSDECLMMIEWWWWGRSDSPPDLSRTPESSELRDRLLTLKWNLSGYFIHPWKMQLHSPLSLDQSLLNESYEMRYLIQVSRRFALILTLLGQKDQPSSYWWAQSGIIKSWATIIWWPGLRMLITSWYKLC
jgi:hypothetical protein